MSATEDAQSNVLKNECPKKMALNVTGSMQMYTITVLRASSAVFTPSKSEQLHAHWSSTLTMLLVISVSCRHRHTRQSSTETRRRCEVLNSSCMRCCRAS